MKKRLFAVCAAVMMLCLCSCGRSHSLEKALADRDPLPHWKNSQTQPVQETSAAAEEDVTLPQTQPVQETSAAAEENVTLPQSQPVQKEHGVIQQVLPMSDGAVAVLYTNGTVNVAGNSQLSEAVADWSSVEQLYYQDRMKIGDAYQDTPTILCRTTDGSILSTAGDFSDWKNIADINCLGYLGVLGITQEGKILTNHAGIDDPMKDAMMELDNVEKIVYSMFFEYAACLQKDGTVKFVDNMRILEETWYDVNEVKDSGHAFYGMRNDGTVVGGLNTVNPGLDHAEKVVSYFDVLFGISPDGRLLTESGGNIYGFAGIICVDVPGSDQYGGEVDIHKYNQLEDIVIFPYGLLLLNRDGTVDSIGNGTYPWDFSRWKNVQKLYSSAIQDENSNYIALVYALHPDGSVSLARDDGQWIDQYCGWRLQEIYYGDNGIIGLTTDGTLVGDGAYANTDFSGI